MPQPPKLKAHQDWMRWRAEMWNTSRLRSKPTPNHPSSVVLQQPTPPTQNPTQA